MKLPVRTRVEFRGETYDFDCDTFTHLVGERPRLCALTGVEIQEGERYVHVYCGRPLRISVNVLEREFGDETTRRTVLENILTSRIELETVLEAINFIARRHRLRAELLPI